MAEILLDQFPVSVTIGRRVWRQVRVVVTGDNRAHLFGLEAGRPVVLATADVTGPFTRRGTPWSVPTAGETTSWEVTRDRGCGCGHPLKKTGLTTLLAAAQ